MSSLSRKIIVIFAVFGFADQAMSQFALRPFSVDSSPLMTELRSVKIARPKMTSEEFADAANGLLDKYGIGFTFYFDTATCDKIDKAFASKKTGEAPPVLKATLNSVGGETASLLLPPPDPASCTRCSVTLPVLQVSAADFITKISERNIKFYMPAGLAADQVQLLDPNDLTKVKQIWRVPFKGVPLGVLYDENAVYLGFSAPEFIDLALLVFDDGTFQFSTRKEAVSNGKGAVYEPEKAIGPAFSYLVFQNRDKKQVVRYQKSCK
jgi:hypothetical protein